MKNTKLASSSIAVLTVAILLGAGPAGAAHSNWQAFGGSDSGDWQDTNHWTAGLPGAGEIAFLNLATSPNWTTITLTADVAVGHVYAQANGIKLNVELAGYDLSATTALRLPYTANGTQEVVFSSSVTGSNISTNTFSIGVAGTLGVSNSVTFKDDLTVTTGGTTIGADGNNVTPTESSLNVIDSASVTIGGTLLLCGRLDAQFNPTNGTITVSDSATLDVNSTSVVELGADNGAQTAEGNLVIDGGSTNVDFTKMSWKHGTFNVILDHATNFNTVAVEGALSIDDDGDDSDVILDIDLDGVAPTAGTIFDVMTWGTTRTGAFTLAAEDTSNWILSYDDTNKIVQAEYVPEPATVTVLLVGGLAAFARRRRRSKA